ncbi:hypothetical protein EB73_34035 [Mycobacterium sp. SWH-M3]|nr:hypothetical protein EB73_34035 [Mycobacterium sp. SWH-M3]
MADMGDNAEICAQIADIVHPVEDWELGDIEGDALITRADQERADQERADYIRRLMLRCDGDTRRKEIGYVEPVDPDDPLDPFYGEGPEADHQLPDPLIEALRGIATKIRTLQARQRELIAYAREFAPPGYWYTLEEIAEAVGMSFSGVRTTFNDTTTANVARSLEIGAHKRGAMKDPRWVAARNAAADRPTRTRKTQRQQRA